MADWVVQLIQQTGYLGIAFLMLAETVFPPIPSEVIMSVAGLEAAKGTLSLPLVILSGTSGAMFGNLFWYFVARALGLERFRPLIDRWGRWLTMDWAEVEKADRWFKSHGAAFVGLGRLLPTVRSLVSVPAGFLHMRLRGFILWSTLGTGIWTAVLATAGWSLGKRYGEIDQYIGPAANAVMILLVVWYLWRVFTWKPAV